MLCFISTHSLYFINLHSLYYISTHYFYYISLYSLYFILLLSLYSIICTLYILVRRLALNLQTSQQNNSFGLKNMAIQSNKNANRPKMTLPPVPKQVDLANDKL